MIDPRNVGAGNNSFVNNGIVRASGGGIVQLTGNGFGEFGGSGTYEALSGSEVQIANSTILRDSTFVTSGTGRVRTLDGTNTTFIDITNTGQFQVGNNADAQMIGTITNSGEIVLASTGSQSDFELGGNVSLTGGGTLTMSGPVAQINAIGGFVLTNEDNTIQGVGNIGGNTASMINHGLIDAAVNGGTISIDPTKCRRGQPGICERNDGRHASRAMVPACNSAATISANWSIETAATSWSSRRCNWCRVPSSAMNWAAAWKGPVRSTS